MQRLHLFLIVALGLLANPSISQNDRGSGSCLDTLSGYLVLRFDSCGGNWQFRGAQLITKTDTITLSMIPAFYEPVYERNQEINRWIRKHQTFKPYEKVKDRILFGIYDRSSPFMVSMDMSNSHIAYGSKGRTSASAESETIYSSSLDPTSHRYVVLRAELLILTISDRVFQHIRPDRFMIDDNQPCYPGVRTSKSIIYKFLSTSNVTDATIDGLGLVRLQEAWISLVIYE